MFMISFPWMCYVIPTPTPNFFKIILIDEKIPNP